MADLLMNVGYVVDALIGYFRNMISGRFTLLGRNKVLMTCIIV